LRPKAGQIRAVAVFTTAAALFFAALDEARAGAWPAPKGKTQVIAKYERQAADEGFTPDGELVAIDHRQEEAASVFLEHGLSDRLTLQARAGLIRGRDRFVAYEGRGPLELGLRYTAVQTPRTVVSVYAGAAEPGAGRNAGYAAPGQGKADFEARLLLGRSGQWRGRPVYLDLQAGRVARAGLADETRMDATLGITPQRDWLLLAQAYGGEARAQGLRARWLKTELSAVRRFQHWGIQAGWRQTVSGRETARDQGIVVALWRGF
jgi:hypothetical protein